MSVPVNERSLSDLEVLVKARELAKYTITITSNEKNFDPMYKDIKDKMVNLSIEIYTLLFSANKTRLDKEHIRVRKSQQEQAYRCCVQFRAMLEIAKAVYHLSAKRCMYWDKLISNVQKLITAWKESDAKRV